MSQCEHHQIELSALIDGETGDGSGPYDHLDHLDHVATCAECRTFYRRARTLNASLSPALPVGRPVARIVAPRRRWSRRLSHVAMLALGVSLTFVLSPLSTSDTPPWARDVGVSQNDMSDQRFVQVAVEMLEAEPRYRREMLNLLEQVFYRETEEGSWSLSHARADFDPVPRFEGDDDRDTRVH